MTTVTIDPVTRIEGHARVLFNVDAAGRVEDARLIVNELRGFERLLVGMEADRMPLITARICGVCPSAHHLAAVNALDKLIGEPVPRAALLLRELLYMGHLIHSHTLSLFVLQGPDLVFGFSAPESTRNIVGLVAAYPELATKALRLRSLGQKINELVGGRGIHPVTAVPGGITFLLDAERHDKLSAWAKEALALATDLVPSARQLLQTIIERHPYLLNDWQIPTYQVATVDDGQPRFCQGDLQIRDDQGNIVAQVSDQEYVSHFVEVTQDDSYLKPVFVRHKSREHVCRAGPLARVNCADRIGTPAADAELERFRAVCSRPCHATVMQTWARAIELLGAAERAVAILRDESIFGPTRVPVALGQGRAVGHVEAPRGTLVHDYEVDEHGIVRAANLIVATQFNYAAINQSLMQALAEPVTQLNDAALLSAVEFAIRCYDPCLSCATHAVGRMPLQVVVIHKGSAVRTIRRDP